MGYGTAELQDAEGARAASHPSERREMRRYILVGYVVFVVMLALIVHVLKHRR